MKKRLLVFSVCLLALTIFGGFGTVRAQGSAAVRRATWQTSVDDSSRGNVVLGIRDKWGSLGRFTASFTVTGPNGKTFRGRTTTTGDEWAYINFPGEFSGGAKAGGTYRVVFYANGVVIGRDRFRFRP
ncbi:MAG: hypothetical protein JSS81_20295 [Acidobacteria bacterium]|nr:hypothetical protein [Acidobacteriota bacterium]